MKQDAFTLDLLKVQYKMMVLESDAPWCWWCGRGIENRPWSWLGPWLIERAHIVYKPRVEDRRAVILLCTICHKVQHGENISIARDERVEPITVANMLWLKRERDRQFYSRAWLQDHSVQKLPHAKQSVEATEYYSRRRA